MMRLIKTLSFLSWCFIGLFSYLNADAVFFQGMSGGNGLKAVHYIRPTTDSAMVAYVAVGEQGWVLDFNNFGKTLKRARRLETDEFDLSGVSFGTGDDTAYGFIVAYKRDFPDKWTGAMLRTTDRGNWWQWINPQRFPHFHEPTPFLDVQVVSRETVWVSCGNGEVIYTTDFGNSWWRTLGKPGGENHFGWLWGVWTPNSNSAWVCSDQSGLISFTPNMGDTWIDYYPFLHHTPPDTFSYRHIYGDLNSPGTVYAAGSKGTIVYTTDGGNNWVGSEPYDGATNCEWVNGIFLHRSYVWCVGTGGTIADENGENLGTQLLWFSKNYDFQDIDGGAIDTSGNYTYLAVGGKPWQGRILAITIDPSLSNEPINRERRHSEQLDMWVEDNAGDNGWTVQGGWSSYPGATHYTLHLLPPPDYNLTQVGEIGNQIGWFPANDTDFTYASVLNGYDYSTFTVRAWQDIYLLDYDDDDVNATDDTCFPQVSNLRGWYNDSLGAAVLHWEPITSTQEPNLGGYWVCPVLAEGINHPTPLLNRDYYIEKLEPTCTSAVFQVCAMDRSGNWGEWSASFYIRPGKISSTSPYASAFSQGRHLVRFNETNALHMVYEDDSKVYYRCSSDNGEHWSKEELANGFFPCIGIDRNGLPWIAYFRDCDIVCRVKKSDGSWKEKIVYDGNDTCWAGAPAIALGTIPDGVNAAPFAYITYPVYEGEEMPDMPAPGPYPSYYNCIKLSILDTVNIAHYLIDEGDAEVPVSDPAVAVTPADFLHLVWQKGGEIWYMTNLDQISYENWQDVHLQEKLNISESPEVPSRHPFVESYGDNVYAAWREGKETDPGEILRRIRDINSEGISSWGPIENISNSADRESDYPVLATSDVVVYEEEVNANNPEIFAWINGEYVNLSETEKSSKYPHIVVEPPQPTQPEILIDAIWTEEIRTDTLYEVKFKRHVHPINPEGMGIGAYLSVTTGDSVASPYCEHRDGFVHFGQYSLDYANTSLIYNLPYLHPKSNYLLKAKVYHALTGRWREKMFADSILGADVYFDPNVPTTVSILLPKESYANDFEIRKEIQRLVGRYAVITDFKIYEVSLPDSGGGGGQSAGSARILKTILYQNSPNPFNTMTEISFGLAKESNVSFSIFDATGRMVRRLINDKLKPGIYNIRWDGKDDEMRNLAQGVYFYRLKTENYIATKKMTLLK